MTRDASEMARLRIAFRGAETVVSVARGETTVGRDKHCTIHLPDPQLAPVHFRIRERSGGFQLKDDGSGIGTHVNGRPVYATTLRHGDVIEAGGLRCVFLTQAEQAEPVPTEPQRNRARARSEATASPAPPAPSRVTPAIWVGVATGMLAVALAVVLLARRSGDTDAAELWREAVAVLGSAEQGGPDAERHLREALRLLERIGRDHPNAPVAASASGARDEAEKALTTLEMLRREARAAARPLSEQEYSDALTRLARMELGAHPAVAERARELAEQLRQVRSARLESAFEEVRRSAAKLVEDKRYGQALRLWREYEPPDYHYRKRTGQELLAIEKRIATEYRGLLRLAARDGELDGRIGLLEASRELFRGTPHSEDLEVRISSLRARRHQQAAVLLREKEKPPEKTTPPEEQPETPTPEEAGPYEEPPRVAELVRARDYGAAASLLTSISRHPRARVRAEELALLANLLADLAAAVQERPGEFTSILLPKGEGRGDALGADAATLRVTREGEEKAYPWAEIPARSFPKLFRTAGFDKPPRLATAVFFDEEGEENEARRRYVAVFESGADPALLTRILARRRGIPEPEGGFLVFRNELVTPAEKDHLLLLDRIEDLGKQARSTNDARRLAAWTDLEQLGEPARETLVATLRERRDQVAAELGTARAFSPSRFAARFGSELKKRREEALRFIADEQKYPYPNKSEEAQREAERLVDLVREIYDHPYARLLETSDGAQALDAEMSRLDDWLARVDPLSEPLRESVADKVRARLDAARIALDDGDRKRIQYNESVEAYNRELKGTTVDAEERANVDAVNRYRHMMGLHALKIDERLVRAARKHSIEMRQLGYFNHDSPTPHLRSPTQRARREGYPGGVAENIARGASTGEQAFWQWFKSSGHHRNMLRPGHTEMACGSAAHHWWTQKFGSATGRSLDPPKVPPDPDPPGQSGNGMPAPEEGS